MSMKTDSSNEQQSPQLVSTELKAGAIGAFSIVMFVMSAQAPIGGIAGAGSLAIAFGNGAAAPAAYLLVGVVICVFALSFTTMAKLVPGAGAFFAYITAGLGKAVGVSSSWVAVLGYSAIQAAMYGFLGHTTSVLIESIWGASVHWSVIVLVAGILVLAIGSSSIQTGAKLVTVLVVAEFAIMLAVVVAVLIKGGPEGVSLTQSFAPSKFMIGAPGIAVMFAVASMFGFEQTAIYASEAKEKSKTVVRATYCSILLIAGFFSIVLWSIITYFGYSSVGERILSMEDPAQFLFQPMAELLGGWTGVVGQGLLASSLFIGIVAFHNTANRYLHALSSTKYLPSTIARTTKSGAPYAAAFTQTGLATIMIAPFVILNLDPMLTLFSWFAGLAVAALLVLYVLTVLSMVVFFRKSVHCVGALKSTVAPAVSGVGFCAFLVLVIFNFPDLIGGSSLTSILIVSLVPTVAILGYASYEIRTR